MIPAAMLLALLAGALAEIWTPPPHRRWPLLTLAVAALVGATVALQNADPGLLTLLARDPRLLSASEPWRVVTALFAQDGGTSGVLSNLFWLLVLGTTAERRFSRIAWLAIYFGGGILTEFLALAWQPHGAGNSVACFALAGALCSDWRKGAWRWWRAGAGLTGLASASVLLLERDIHGIGFFAGLAIGAGLVATKSAIRRNGEVRTESRSNVVFMDGTDTRH